MPDRPLYVLGGAATTNDDQVAVTLYDLQRCIDSQEAKIVEWQAKADAHLQRARAAHRQQQPAAAQMRLHKLHQRQVEQAQGALENLHMSQHAVEASQHQTVVVDALRSATMTLRAVRDGAAAGNTEEDLTEVVDTVVDDLADELADWQGVHDTLASMNNHGDNVDDDALLRELDELIEKDNGTGDGDAPLAATTTTTAESLPSSSAAASDGPKKSPPLAATSSTAESFSPSSSAAASDGPKKLSPVLAAGKTTAGEASKERAKNEKQPVASLS